MEKHQKNTIENYIRSYNEFDIEGMTRNLTEDIVFENMTNGNVDLRTDGLIEFKKQAESAKQYFTKREQEIVSWEFKDSKVTIGIYYEGVLAIDLPNGAEAGDTLELKGTSEFVFEEGRIKSITDKS